MKKFNQYYETKYWSHLALILKFRSRFRTQDRDGVNYFPRKLGSMYNEFEKSYDDLLWINEFKNIYFVVKKKEQFDLISFFDILGLEKRSEREWYIYVNNLGQMHQYQLYSATKCGDAFNGAILIEFEPLSIKTIDQYVMDHIPPMNTILTSCGYVPNQDQSIEWPLVQEIHRNVKIVMAKRKFNEDHSDYNIEIANGIIVSELLRNVFQATMPPINQKKK